MSYHNLLNDAGTGGYCTPAAAVSARGALSRERRTAFSFLVRRSGLDWSGFEEWELHSVSAGVLEGSLAVTMFFPSCSEEFRLRAVR